MVSNKPISVSQLNGYIKGVFEDELVLHNISVFGEIYEFGISGQNTFITLKEDDCVLNCVRYGLTEKYELGTKVLLGGTVTFYSKGGRVSFVIHTIKPYGESVQYAAFLRLKEKLRAAGWFEDRPPLKPFMKDAVIVTSMTGAVIHDFIRVITDKQKFVNIRLFPVRVQGEGAAEEIAAAIRAVNAHTRADVIVVARGGGANVDLEPFNTETVAAAVHESVIPVLSAVGHETDFTLCDFCASARAATPSVAGEMITSANARLIDYVYGVMQSVSSRAARLFESYSRRIYRAAYGITANVDRRVATNAERARGFGRRLSAAVAHLMETAAASVRGASDEINKAAHDTVIACENAYGAVLMRLEAHNPLRILSKGYARVTRDGREIVSSKQLKAGDTVSLRFYDGTVKAKVGE